MSTRLICITNKFSEQKVWALTNFPVIFIGILFICHTSMVLPNQRAKSSESKGSSRQTWFM